MEPIRCNKCGKEVNPTDEVCPHCGHVFGNENEEEEAFLNKQRKPLFTKRDHLLFWGGCSTLSLVPTILCFVSKAYDVGIMFAVVVAIFSLIFFLVLFNE